MVSYTKEFYQTHEERSLRSAQIIIPIVLDFVKPTSVVDVGCATGTWLAVFKKMGVDDIWGVDGLWLDKNSLQIPPDRFITTDLEESIQLDREFDLVVSLEVAEHLPPESAKNFVESLTKLGPVVLFSASIPYQRGANHLNEQWPEYWVKMFKTEGFISIDCLRHQVWNDKRIAWWYSQNILLFVKEDRLGSYPELEKEHRNFPSPPLPLVHPQNYLRVARLQNHPLLEIIKALPSILLERIKKRI